MTFSCLADSRARQKVSEKIGRLRQKYGRASRYDINIDIDAI
jgi:hypothetical protein